MLAGCPFWNWTVSRSYPGCVPVRRSSMKATAGACAELIGPDDAHTKGGRDESGVGEGSGLTPGLTPGDGETLGVGLDPIPGPIEFAGRFSGLATNKTPMTTAAMTAAATPAIQKGPLCSGTSVSEDRTRSDRAALGDPVMSSKT
jgi:hypothetical protein